MSSNTPVSSESLVDVGRRKPQVAHQEDIPTTKALRAYDSIRPMKRNIVIEKRSVKEIDMGRRKPGSKF
jgi:hypothetical protein